MLFCSKMSEGEKLLSVIPDHGSLQGSQQGSPFSTLSLPEQAARRVFGWRFLYELALFLYITPAFALCVAGLVVDYPDTHGMPWLRDWLLDGAIVGGTCWAVSLCTMLLELILFYYGKRRALQALHDAATRGAVLVFSAEDPMFVKFVEEEWGAGGRRPWCSSFASVCAGLVVWAIFGGIIFAFVILRSWAGAGFVPNLGPLAAFCFGGVVAYGLVYYTIKVAVTNRLHYTFALSHGGVAALSPHAVCFNGEVYPRPHGSVTTVTAVRNPNGVPYVRIAVRRGKKTNQIRVPVLTNEHAQVLARVK